MVWCAMGAAGSCGLQLCMQRKEGRVCWQGHRLCPVVCINSQYLRPVGPNVLAAHHNKGAYMALLPHSTELSIDVSAVLCDIHAWWWLLPAITQ